MWIGQGHTNFHKYGPVPYGGRAIQHSTAHPALQMAAILHVSWDAKVPSLRFPKLRISYSKKIPDYFVKWFLNRVPFRCRKCRLRFYSREPQLSSVLMEAAAVRQWAERTPQPAGIRFAPPINLSRCRCQGGTVT